MKVRLVKGANRAWTWFSVQMGGVLVVLPQAWAYMPDDVKGWIPEEWRPAIVSVLGLAVVVGRLVDQGGEDGNA